MYEPILTQITVSIKYVEYLLTVSNFQPPGIDISTFEITL